MYNLKHRCKEDFYTFFIIKKRVFNVFFSNSFNVFSGQLLIVMIDSCAYNKIFEISNAATHTERPVQRYDKIHQKPGCIFDFSVKSKIWYEANKTHIVTVMVAKNWA